MLLQSEALVLICLRAPVRAQQAGALIPQHALLYWLQFVALLAMCSHARKACQRVVRLGHAVGKLLLCLLTYSPIGSSHVNYHKAFTKQALATSRLAVLE